MLKTTNQIAIDRNSDRESTLVGILGSDLEVGLLHLRSFMHQVLAFMRGQQAPRGAYGIKRLARCPVALPVSPAAASYWLRQTTRTVTGRRRRSAG